MDDALVVQVRLQGGSTVIAVAGEIDIATAPQLGHYLAALAGSGRPVIADLDQVSFIDAAGLHVLAAAARLAAARGGSLHVVSAQHQVRRIFALTGLDRQLPLARTRAGALAGLPAGRETGPARANLAGGPRPQAALPAPGRGRRAQPQHETGKEVTGW
jgi:anti-sigma B factor antagonist